MPFAANRKYILPLAKHIPFPALCAILVAKRRPYTKPAARNRRGNNRSLHISCYTEATMPTLVSRIMRRQIRLLRPVYASFSLKTARAFTDGLARLGAKAVEGKVRFDDFFIGGIPASTAIPMERRADDDKTLLYLHGGGYVTGGLEYARGYAGLLAAETGHCVTAIAYRLAPENPYPAALDDAFGAYEYLLRYYDAENISLIGESAGGGLILALCHRLKAESLPLPARLVLISPWTDLTLSGRSYTENCKTDPSLTFEEVEFFAEAYAPDDRSLQFVSPLFGDFTGFPPCRIFAGGDELLRDDSLRLYDRMIESGAECKMTVGDGMWHAYVLYPTPESSEAMEEIRAFLEDDSDAG